MTGTENMSLTSFLKLPDVKEKFRQEFRVPELTAQKQLIAPPLSKRYPLVGTAFDYLLRFHLQRLNDGKAIRWPWKAEEAELLTPHVAGLYRVLRHGTARLPGRIEEVDVHQIDVDRCGPDDLFCEILPNGDISPVDIRTRKTVIEAEDQPARNIGPIFSKACAEHERYIVSGEITDELIQSVIHLAQLDCIYRQGKLCEENLYGCLGVALQEDVQDLRNLITVVMPDFFKAKEICLLNPAFGSASALVGGADADLLIDDTLVDIKTTKNLRLDPDHFYQLLGYFVLHSLAGIGDLVPKRDINKLAIYYSRHAHLEVFELRDIVSPQTFPKFVKWFSARARKYLKTA